MHTYSMNIDKPIQEINGDIKARLRRLAKVGPFVAGSLNRIEKKSADGGKTVSYLLTFKEKGKTKSVYVPKDMVPEVKKWVKRHQELKKLMAEIAELSIGVIRRYVREKKAESRGKRR